MKRLHSSFQPLAAPSPGRKSSIGFNPNNNTFSQECANRTAAGDNAMHCGGPRGLSMGHSSSAAISSNRVRLESASTGPNSNQFDMKCPNTNFSAVSFSNTLTVAQPQINVPDNVTSRPISVTQASPSYSVGEKPIMKPPKKRRGLDLGSDFTSTHSVSMSFIGGMSGSGEIPSFETQTSTPVDTSQMYVNSGYTPVLNNITSSYVQPVSKNDNNQLSDSIAHSRLSGLSNSYAQIDSGSTNYTRAMLGSESNSLELRGPSSSNLILTSPRVWDGASSFSGLGPSTSKESSVDLSEWKNQRVLAKRGSAYFPGVIVCVEMGRDASGGCNEVLVAFDGKDGSGPRGDVVSFGTGYGGSVDIIR